MRSLLRKLFIIVAVPIAAARALRTVRLRSPSGRRESERIGPVRRSSLRRWAVELAVLLAMMGFVGFLIAASGIVPIKASSGHWPITRWFLNFSMARSVSLHARGIEVPELKDPALVLRGAGAYETACRACHGSPSLHAPRVTAEMTPEPPYLPDVMSQWEPHELFYIVKHGVKFTGMPAWPARNREDEVWAMVAFLLRLADLEPDEYEQLVFGAAGEMEGAPLERLSMQDAVPRDVVRTCARCHGSDGTGRGNAAFPSLAGQKEEYLYNALQAFARGVRHSGVMEPIAAGVDDVTMRRLARYFASLPPRRGSGTANPDSIARGRTLALEGIPSKKIPACAGCHGPKSGPTKAGYPRLQGQYAEYLILQLDLFARGHRGGSRYAHLMNKVAPHLEEEHARDVANYYESLWSAVRSEAEHRFVPGQERSSDISDMSDISEVGPVGTE